MPVQTPQPRAGLPLPVASPRPPPARRALGVALCALLVALVLSGAVSSAPGQYITGAEPLAVDLDGDGLFDLLNISVAVEAPAVGLYNLRVTLAWPTPATPTPITTKTEIFHLDDRPQSIRMTIDGPRIREKGLNGPYEIQVNLISSPSGPVDDSATFLTPPWLASDFAEGEDTGKPRLAWGDTEATLASDDLRATVNLTAPTVEWETGSGTAAPGRFAVSFPSVVSFDDDNGDGALAADEAIVCTAPLDATPWVIDSLDIGPSPEFGSFISFTIAGPVQFAGAACAARPAGNVSLSFLIAQHDGTVEGPSPFTLMGGLEVKVDVEVALSDPVPGAALALEVTLEDLDGNTSFRLRGAQGFETLERSGNATTDLEPIAPGAPETPERVAFTDALGAVRGHFSWVPVASERLAQGQERFVEVTASRGTAGPLLRLFLAVPNDPELVSLSFDPAVGVPEPVSLPMGDGGGGVEPPKEQPSATIFVVSLIAVTAIFFLSTYARAKKY